MTVTQINTDELNISTKITCQGCGNVWHTESKTPRATCPECQQKMDRESGRRIITIPTKHIGPTETIEEVADLLEEYAEAVRDLYEAGWVTNSDLDGPNCIRATAEAQLEDGSDSKRPPITDEEWRADGEMDASTGIGLIEYVAECLLCEDEFIVSQDTWDVDGTIAAEDEVFCHNCEMAVGKQVVGLEFSLCLSERFRHTHDLRKAALDLKGLSAWLRGLDQHGWYLDRFPDHCLRLRYAVDDEAAFTLDHRGHLKELHN